jgi:protein-S-isoprenylcysteine O-methyltransferase Ste14
MIMASEWIFRLIFVLAAFVMVAVRAVSQSRVIRDQGGVAVHEGPVSLVAGSVAALVSIVFGLEYIVAPGALAFAYGWAFPAWLRWVGAVAFPGGVALLAWAHYHLGKSFHSLIVTKEDHVLVDTGPYRYIRHPIYLAYLANYVGGGLLAGNRVLTVVPIAAYAVLIVLRLGQEERVMISKFGDAYEAYMARTGRLVPKIAVSGQRRPGVRSRDKRSAVSFQLSAISNFGPAEEPTFR